MSRHESVSCDSCMKANFKGRRYKCLICYDYDLCAACHEIGVTTARHSTDHPMQCILTRSDFDLFYGGDAVSSEQPQSFTCPYCGNMGFTEGTLATHVNEQHSDSSAEVICPVCAALPGGDPNLVSDDFYNHLTTEHRSREPFEVESMASHRSNRRLGSSRRGARSRHYTPSNPTTASSNSSSFTADPIAELLSHLSGVHRLSMRAPQLRELQMQIEAERALRISDPATSYREQIQRLAPRRTGAMYESPSLSNSATHASSSTESTRTAAGIVAGSANSASKTLLSKYLEVEKLTGKALEEQERTNAEHSLFLQEVLLATLSEPHLTEPMQDSLESLSNSLTNTLSINNILENQQAEASAAVADSSNKSEEDDTS